MHQSDLFLYVPFGLRLKLDWFHVMPKLGIVLENRYVVEVIFFYTDFQSSKFVHYYLFIYCPPQVFHISCSPPQLLDPWQPYFT